MSARRVGLVAGRERRGDSRPAKAAGAVVARRRLDAERREVAAAPVGGVGDIGWRRRWQLHTHDPSVADRRVGGTGPCPSAPSPVSGQVGPGQRHGRSRRTATGRAHQRPLNRHERSRLGGSAATAVGFGHRTSIAATIATASSSVGAGDRPSSRGRARFMRHVVSSSIDQLARVGRITTVPAMLSWNVRRCELPSAIRKPMNRIIETSMRDDVTRAGLADRDQCRCGRRRLVCS